MNRGFASLLNLGARRHFTAFVTDFDLPEPDVRRLRRELAPLQTELLFLKLEESNTAALRKLKAAGVRPEDDYVSLQGLVCRGTSLGPLHALFDGLPHRDMGRLEIPREEVGFRPAFASYLLRVISRSDYAEQDRISRRFFALLSRESPYHIVVESSRGVLEIRDTAAWFDFAGRLREGEARFLPGGEVAYNGMRANGEFVVDGAILPTAQRPAAAIEARRLQRLSSGVGRNALTLIIESGRVTNVVGKAARELLRLFDRDDSYRDVTEVGISFNGACRRFVHDWPAVSNETRPGVHLGLGGGGTSRNSGVLVHLDCIAANCRVYVNGSRFLSASS